MVLATTSETERQEARREEKRARPQCRTHSSAKDCSELSPREFPVPVRVELFDQLLDLLLRGLHAKESQTFLEPLLPHEELWLAALLLAFHLLGLAKLQGKRHHTFLS